MFNFKSVLIVRSLHTVIEIGTQCVLTGCSLFCAYHFVNLFVFQLLSKLENTDEGLTEERRRHEETKNQLETTRRQLEAAEKV